MAKVPVYYGDASGSAYQANDVAQIVAGFLTNEDCWSGFCAEWEVFLQGHGLKALHMNELTDDVDPRQRILDAAIAVITKPDFYLRRFVTVVDATAFKKYQLDNGNSEFALGKANHAYPFGAYAHIAVIEGFCEERRISQPNFVLESGDPFQTHLAKALREKGYAVPRLLPKVMDGKAVLQFQACDFLAYEYLQGYRKNQICDAKLEEPMPKGELSPYLLAFRKLDGSDGIWSEENIRKPKILEESIRRLLDIKQHSDSLAAGSVNLGKPV